MTADLQILQLDHISGMEGTKKLPVQPSQRTHTEQGFHGSVGGIHGNMVLSKEYSKALYMIDMLMGDQDGVDVGTGMICCIQTFFDFFHTDAGVQQDIHPVGSHQSAVPAASADEVHYLHTWFLNK